MNDYLILILSGFMRLLFYEFAKVHLRGIMVAIQLFKSYATVFTEDGVEF